MSEHSAKLFSTMDTALLASFFNELEKISSDLMNPAVVADSDAVTGAAPTPFTRRKGYRKLEKDLVKEAVLQKFLKPVTDTGKHILKVVNKANTAIGQGVYSKLPNTVKDLHSKHYTKALDTVRKLAT